MKYHFDYKHDDDTFFPAAPGDVATGTVTSDLLGDRVR